MTRRIVVLAVGLGLVVGLAIWPSPGEAKKCTGPNFKCNSPVGCEIRNQMMVKWAYRSVFASDRLAVQAKAQAEAAMLKTYGSKSGFTTKEWDSMVDRDAAARLSIAAAEGASSLAKDLPDCKSGVQQTPGMETVRPPKKVDRSNLNAPEEKSCKIVVHLPGGDESPESAKPKLTNTCDEITDASLEHEKYHLARCNPKAADTQGLDALRTEEMFAYTKEIHALRDATAAVGRWCTPVRAFRAEFIAKAKAATSRALADGKGTK